MLTDTLTRSAQDWRAGCDTAVFAGLTRGLRLAVRSRKIGTILHQTSAHFAQVNHSISLPICCVVAKSVEEHWGQELFTMPSKTIQTAA